jgi:Cdc6-like AAA superfamily ATPase
MKITKQQLKQIIKEELSSVLENVPNPEFRRAAHGGKSCEEWNQEILRLRDALHAAEEDQYSLEDPAEMYQTDDTVQAAIAGAESGDVEAAAKALKDARRAAKKQKCPTN